MIARLDTLAARKVFCQSMLRIVGDRIEKETEKKRKLEAELEGIESEIQELVDRQRLFDFGDEHGIHKKDRE